MSWFNPVRWFRAHRKVIDFIWGNKQAIVGGVTTSVSGFAAAKPAFASVAVWITLLTGTITMILGALYTFLDWLEKQKTMEPPAP